MTAGGEQPAAAAELEHPATDNAASKNATTENPGTKNYVTVDQTVDPAQLEQPWRRLAPGMLLVEPVRELIKFIPMLIVLIFAGQAGDSGPPWGLIGTAAVIALGISRWVTTRYRITPTVVELRRGVFQRKHLTVPRDRVRTVDISAHPLQRVLHLAKVQIGTGISHGRAEQLALDGLPVAVSGPLRAELLHRSRAAESATAARQSAASGTEKNAGQHGAGEQDSGKQDCGEQDSGPTPDSEHALAAFRPRWILYAPATLSGVVTAAFLVGLAWRVINEAQVKPANLSFVPNLLRHLRQTPVWLDILQGTVVVAVAVTVLSLAGYLISYWGYSLTRHSRGTLQVTRGLLTTRATTIEERRLLGLERTEPLLLRWSGGARLQAIATGLHHRGPDRGAALLVPPAPLGTVLGVEAAVLGSPSIAGAALLRHGPAARRRRYNRTIGGALILIGVLIALSLWRQWPLPVLFLALPILLAAALLARDRYRNLGHLITEGRLVAAAGSLVRRRNVLAVSGVIGVTLHQSVFQRRSGVISLTATTAAGAQHYLVADLPAAAAIDLAVALVPQTGAFTRAVDVPTGRS